MPDLNAYFEAHGTQPPPDPNTALPAESQTAKVPAADEQEKPLDLKDAIVQDSILNPEGTVFKLNSGEEIRVFPLTMRAKRRTFGFVTRIAQDAAAMPIAANTNLEGRLGSVTLRVVGLLNERQRDEDEMLYLLAKATGKPGEIDDVKAQKLAAELADRAEPGDLLQIYNMLGRLAGVVRAKNAPGARPATNQPPPSASSTSPAGAA